MSVDNSLMLEHLKAIRADTTAMRSDTQEIKFRVTQLEIGQANILSAVSQNFADFAGQQVKIDSLRARLERIERRLELTEPDG